MERAEHFRQGTKALFMAPIQLSVPSGIVALETERLATCGVPLFVTSPPTRSTGSGEGHTGVLLPKETVLILQLTV
jgi:hypothetical protein